MWHWEPDKLGSSGEPGCSTGNQTSWVVVGNWDVALGTRQVVGNRDVALGTRQVGW